jgi:signal transduction histidine kinase/CheY-like chemotaxis protein
MKVFLVITSVVLIFTVANMVMGLCFTQPRLLKTVESDMSAVAEVADRLITSEINLLKALTAGAAQKLLEVGEKDLREALKEQVEENENFLALTVFDPNGVAAAYGESPTPVSWLREENVQRAFAGEMNISSTRLSETTWRGHKTSNLVFHVCVPMGERVLSASVPGMIFSDMLKDIKIWTTGNIFILDAEGTMIANFRPSMVEKRENYIEIGKTDPRYKTMGEFFLRMISNERGVGTYDYLGVERMCVYRPISGSKVGWVLGIAAPLEESPAAHVQRGLVIAALIFLALGISAAVYLSSLIAKPFQQVEEQNRRLADLSEEAQSASKAKSRFLANMSHEMRTPLNAVVGLSELMLGEEEVQGEAEENLAKIHNAGMTLLGIVNDILDISKIESGKFELLPIDYDLPSLINDTITLNIMRIEDKPITFNLHIDENLPNFLHGDELRVKQICNNMLSNAFKYTREGSVDWTLSCERDGDAVWLTVRVADSGIGIKPEDLRKLFSEYNQVDTSSNRLIEGTGLGLSITKMMAEMMDGSITAESEYGRGSVFTARLRQGYVSEAVIGPKVAENLRSFRYCDSKRLNNAKLVRVQMPYARVLVVDDVQTNLDVAKGMLKPYGVRVDCLISGRQAVQRLREGDIIYNAIFMDHMMPEMDGIETVRRIRLIGTDYAREVPIIALTANAIIGNEKMFLENGFQAFLSKPIDVMELDSVMRQWIRRKELEREDHVPPAAAAPVVAPDEAEQGTAAALNLAGLNPGVCGERFGGDRGVYLQVLRSYAANTAPLLEQIRVVTPELPPEYAVIVHGIKGSSRGVGAYTIGDMAAELEQAAKTGDLDFVRLHNEAFLTAAEELLDALSAALGPSEEGKPVKEAPDQALLARLTQHCAEYDMDGIDAVMSELDGFKYENETDLVAWLREKIALMEFAEINDRLRPAV